MLRFFVSLFAVSLMSASANAALQASPSWINFGSVEVNSILGSTRSVQIRNVGPDAASISVSSVACFEFAVQNTNCWAVLPPGGSCSMQVSFRPRSVGSKSCHIRVSDHTGAGTSVSMSGMGIKR